MNLTVQCDSAVMQQLIWFLAPQYTRAFGFTSMDANTDVEAVFAELKEILPKLTEEDRDDDKKGLYRIDASCGAYDRFVIRRGALVRFSTDNPSTILGLVLSGCPDAQIWTEKDPRQGQAKILVPATATNYAWLLMLETKSPNTVTAALSSYYNITHASLGSSNVDTLRRVYMAHVSDDLLGLAEAFAAKPAPKFAMTARKQVVSPGLPDHASDTGPVPMQTKLDKATIRYA